MDYRKYPIRIYHSMHKCNLCQTKISLGEFMRRKTELVEGK
jgi:hypothetical protein